MLRGKPLVDPRCHVPRDSAKDSGVDTLEEKQHPILMIVSPLVAVLMELRDLVVLALIPPLWGSPHSNVMAAINSVLC